MMNHHNNSSQQSNATFYSQTSNSSSSSSSTRSGGGGGIDRVFNSLGNITQDGYDLEQRMHQYQQQHKHDKKQITTYHHDNEYILSLRETPYVNIVYVYVFLYVYAYVYMYICI